MSYAVLQKTLDRPEIERLRRAFVSVPGLTAADAHILGNDAYGILVNHFPYDRAYALKNALASEGIETEIVEEAALPQLPAAKRVTRLDPKDDALMIYDPLGRPFPLDWQHLSLLAAGAVRMQEHVRVERMRPRHRLDSLGGLTTEFEKEMSSREQTTENHFLEFLVGGALQRYSFLAEKASPLTFGFLGERRTGDPVADWRLLGQELIRRAPQAVCNRGALALRAEGAADYSYPSRHTFQEETVWILWRLRQATPEVA